eukprot:gene16287-biopygen9310
MSRRMLFFCGDAGDVPRDTALLSVMCSQSFRAQEESVAGLGVRSGKPRRRIFRDTRTYHASEPIMRHASGPGTLGGLPRGARFPGAAPSAYRMSVSGPCLAAQTLWPLGSRWTPTMVVVKLDELVELNHDHGSPFLTGGAIAR